MLGNFKSDYFSLSNAFGPICLFVTNPEINLMVPLEPIPMLAPAPLVPLVPTLAHQAHGQWRYRHRKKLVSPHPELG